MIKKIRSATRSVATGALGVILVVVGLGTVGCDDRSRTSAPPSPLTVAPGVAPGVAPRVAPRVPPRVDLNGADPAVIHAVPT